MKRYWKQAVGILISALCLVVFFWGVDIDQAAGILRQILYLPMVCALAINISTFWVRAWRWKYFFRPEHKPTVAGLTIANLIGFMGNTIFPLRIGELVRAVMGKRKTEASLSYILATLFVERLFDMLCLILCLIVPIMFNPQVFRLPAGTSGLLIAFFGLILLIFLVTRLKPDLIMNLSLPVARKIFPRRFSERIHGFLQKFTEGLMVLKNGTSLFKIVLLSLFHWWLIVFSYYLAFLAFSLSSLPWSAPYFTIGLVGMGSALPSAPAYLGTFHAAFIFSLNEIYGVDKSMAAGLAVIIHLLMSLILVLAGLAALWYEGLTLGQITRKIKITEA
ncbi:MAG TPA: lysylphosphatidylglycerol synthase transmembrane domain-containing protein [archaeon]|nr:lysylphosphatidylglycerol synthase transmembrane domain-containing protein [archaeon]